VAHQIEHLVAVSPFVVIPGHELDEVVVQAYAGVRVENRGARVGDEIAGDDFILSVAYYTLPVLALGGGLHHGLYLVISGGLFEAAGEIDHGDVRRGYAERHARELAVERGYNLAHGLGRAGGAGDDVKRRAAPAAPVLLGGAVDGELGGCGGMDGCHKAL